METASATTAATSQFICCNSQKLVRPSYNFANFNGVFGRRRSSSKFSRRNVVYAVATPPKISDSSSSPSKLKASVNGRSPPKLSTRVGEMSDEIKRVRAQMEENEELAILMRGLRGQNLSDSQFAADDVQLRLVEVDESSEFLPLVYDPAIISAYWGKRPCAVATRIIQLLSVAGGFLSHLLWDVVNKKVKENEVARAIELREIVTSLGPAYIKLGQALSIRPDILSPSAMVELQKLCDKVPSFPDDVAMALIEEELGKPWQEIYDELSPSPIAAASLGQVYKGRLKENGDLVAVKVQRPFVLETVTIDLFIIRNLGLALRKFPQVSLDVVGLVDEWAARFFEELDYINEGENGTLFAEMMRKDLPQVIVPKTYQKYTSRKVLTTQWIDGEKLSQSTEGDVGELVNVGVICYLKQLLDTGFFHADPHPGNMIRTPDGKLAILDFGLVTKLTDDQKYGMIEAIAHLIHRDYDAIVKDFVKLGFIPEGVNLDPILPVLAKVFDQALEGGGAKNINFQELASDLAQITFDYPFRIPPYFALIIRAIGVLEGIALVGDPDFAIVDEAYPYIAQRQGPTSQLDGIATPDSKKFSEPFELINDEVVKISAILLRPENNGPAFDIDNGELGTALKPGDISVIYVCELPKIQGKFHPEKAKALGLRPGPKYRDLQNGETVKTDDLKITIRPEDVMDPPIPGPIVLLVDCPTTSHLHSLSSLDSLNSYYTDLSDHTSEAAKAVNCVIHLSPSSVSNSPEYQTWMKRFGNAQHIMAGHEQKNAEIPVLKSSARIAARLNYLCPQFFPVSGFWSSRTDNYSSHSNSSTEGSQAVISAENLLKFNLRPHANLGLDRCSIPIATRPAEIVDELQVEIPEIVDAVEQVRRLWDHTTNGQADVSPHAIVEEPWFDELGLPSCLENITREDMEIVLLGTGSSQPSKYRNVSSIFINLFSKGSMLFDCGEGTLGQLKRRFGVEGADDAVRNLRCIWISHIHADHHTGLARILALRRDLLKDVPHEPLLVVGPGQLMRFLNAYQRLEELDMEFLDCKFTTHASWDSFEKSNSDSGEPTPSNSESPVDSTLFSKGSPMQSYWQKPGSPVGNGVVFQRLKSLRKVLQETGLETLISVPVVHCPQAFGVSLKAAARRSDVGEMIPGWKIVYSGDTRPCPQLIEESRGATVLIHEATFEDAMVDEAVARNHSTTKEAIEVGEAAGVYRIILTHFSQRYPKIPVFGDAHMHNTCIGFDMMSINLADLPVLPRVLPHLKLLFRNEMGVDEVEDLPLEAISEA